MLAALLQLTKPERTLANVLTATAGYLLATTGPFNWVKFIALLTGTTLVIASACVVNNLTDSAIDAQMPRTASRVLPKHQLPRTLAAWFAVILGLAGFLTLALWVGWLVVGLGIIAYIDYVAAYGYAKRHTIHSTIIGTVSGAMSITAGYVAARGHFDAGAAVVFLILLTWQMPHFFAIAIYRAHDYAKAHIPVMPLVKGARLTKIQMLVYTLVFGLASQSLWLLGYTGLVYAYVMAVLVLYWLYLAIDGLRRSDDVRWAKGMFKYSLVVLVVFCVLVSFGARG